MKILISMLSALGLMAGAVSVSAATKSVTYSATITHDGKIEAQSPNWINSTEYTSQKDYGASYKIKFMPGAFNKPPKYCHVSTFDSSSYEHVLHGIAKLSSKPTREEVNVIGVMLGLDRPSGDSSMSFYLVCGK